MSERTDLPCFQSKRDERTCPRSTKFDEPAQVANVLDDIGRSQEPLGDAEFI